MKNASIQRIVCVRTICKRCNQIFNFKNKFHEHIRQHHARKFVILKNSDFRVFTFEFTYKIIEKSTVFCSFVSFISQICFVYSFCNITKSNVFSENVFAICFTQKFAFFNFEIQNYIKIDEEIINELLVYFFILIFSNFCSKTSRMSHAKMISYYE